jgi:hypothetical protein
MQNKTIKIDLNLNIYPQGTALYLLGVARILSKQLGIDMVQVHREMTYSDYENLIKTFEKYFGDYVTLQR